MVSAILSSVGVPVLVQVLKEALGRVNHPAAKTAAEALGGLDDVLRSGQVSEQQLAEANRHAEAMAEKRLKEYETALSEVNKSLRSEILSDDKYVRRMRPTFGYLMALTWSCQMLGLAYVVVFKTAQAHVVLQAMESLSSIWMIGLSVLGIYVYRRSDDKKLSADSLVPLLKKKEVLSDLAGEVKESTVRPNPYNS